MHVAKSTIPVHHGEVVNWQSENYSILRNSGRKKTKRERKSQGKKNGSSKEEGQRSKNRERRVTIMLLKRISEKKKG